MHYTPEGVKLKDVSPGGSQVYDPNNQTRNKQLKPDYDKAVEEQNTWINDPTGAKRKAEKKAKASLLNNKPIEGGEYSQQELDQLSLLKSSQQPQYGGLLA